jgi:membrane associated rhomboid family serine protease
MMGHWTLRIIIANVIMFVITLASPAVTMALVFVPSLVLSRPWTLITYMFLHADFWHILFNMLGLYFFGPRLEEELGARHYLTLYAVSGLSGALLSFLTPHSAILGASGAVYGVFLGFAYFWPRERILVWGIIPVEARVMVIIMTALSLYGGFGGGGGGIAHFAHLGGFAGGYLYLKYQQSQTRAAKFRAATTKAPPRSTDLERWRRIDASSLHEVNRVEFERIMGKLQTNGLGSLTAQEHEFLDRFSSREDI